MLGFSVSQAAVSRYMPARRRRPGQSWRTFLRNQAMAFGHCEYSEERSREEAGPQGQSYGGEAERSEAAQIATLRVRCRRSLAQPQLNLNDARNGLRSAHRDRGKRMVLPPSRAAQGDASINVQRSLFRSEVHCVQLGCAITVTAERFTTVALVHSRARVDQPVGCHCWTWMRCYPTNSRMSSIRQRGNLWGSPP
jgi:hypothetical protein